MIEGGGDDAKVIEDTKGKNPYLTNWNAKLAFLRYEGCAGGNSQARAASADKSIALAK